MKPPKEEHIHTTYDELPPEYHSHKCQWCARLYGCYKTEHTPGEVHMCPDHQRKNEQPSSNDQEKKLRHLLSEATRKSKLTSIYYKTYSKGYWEGQMAAYQIALDILLGQDTYNVYAGL